MQTEQPVKKNNNNTILVIIGPSASGKTNFAINLAKYYKKNIISADSRQIYKNLDYSTGKFPLNKRIKRGKQLWKINKIKYYGYDIVNPNTEFSAYEFARFANRIIKKEKNNLPIICGGTGMYINALMNNYEYKHQPPNWELRNTLKNKKAEELLKILELKGYDINLLNNSEKFNIQRLIRRIETFKNTSLSLEKAENETKYESKYKYLVIGIEKNDYEESIKTWIQKNFENAVKEVKWLIKKYPHSTVIKGFIFSQINDYLENKISEEEAKQKIYFEYKHYIKRQKTYFNKYFKNAVWFNDKIKAFDYIKNTL